MFEGIKERLGFGGEGDYDQNYDGEYDSYEDNFDGYDYEDDSYSPYAPVTTRDTTARRGFSSEYAPENYSPSRTTSHPRLVSYDDVRASTQIPESLNRDPLPPRRSSVGRASDYIAQSNDDLYTQDTVVPEVSSVSTEKSGYDSLFASTTPATAPVKPSSEVGVSVHTPIGATPMVSDSYDPYRAYESGAGSTSALHTPTRKVTVIAPSSYNEVENVARMLRAGDVVVLALAHTPSQLSKRVLDFSFGVASALDASVDCVSDKVFAITKGQQITEAERMRLRNQGIL